MRWLRAYGSLVRADLTQGWLWCFLVAVALVGPCFVIFDAVTDRTTWESRPLLSEPATVEHFDTTQSLRLAYPGTDNVDLLRSPDVESSTDFPLPRAFRLGWTLVPVSIRSDFGGTTWNFPNIGSALDFYRLLFPLLMAVAGVLALPSRRRLDLLRTVVPSGRWGCYLLLSGRSILETFLLSAITALFLAAATALAGASALEAWLFALRYGVLLTVYGSGFALFGLAVAQLIRSRKVALLLVAALMIGVAPFLAIGQSHLLGTLADAFPEVVSSSPLAESPSPASWITSSLLVPPQDTFYWLAPSTWSEVPESVLAGAVRLPTSTFASLWVRLVWFAAFWWLIGWATTPRRIGSAP